MTPNENQNKEWFYNLNGQNIGPINEQAFLGMISGGVITRQTMVWTQGMAEWQSASVVFPNLFTAPPPMTAPNFPPMGNNFNSTANINTEHTSDKLGFKEHRLIWFIALIPLLVVLIEMIAQQHLFALRLISSFVIIIAVLVERKKLIAKFPEIKTKVSSAFVTFIFYPIYIWKRTNALGMKKILPIATLVSMAIYIFTTFSAYDGDVENAIIEVSNRNLRNLGFSERIISCEVSGGNSGFYTARLEGSDGSVSNGYYIVEGNPITGFKVFPAGSR